MHRLPTRPLVTLLHSYSAEGRRIRQQLVNLGVPESGLHKPSPLRLDLERPWRIMNQRRRLYACHWAGWTPERTSKRWGAEGPKWLGGRP